MQYRNLGQSEIKSSVVVLGTWALGGWMWGGTDKKTGINAIHAALDAGINTIDTAPVYGFGQSEELVGEALKGRRDAVVIATKCGLTWHQKQGEHYFNSSAQAVYKDGRKDGQYQVYRYLGAESIRYEVEQSLRRLQTDYIDLYQTHWQEKTTPIEETMQVLLELKAEGKIRAIGVSNANATQMEAYRKYGQLDTDQEKYSMLDLKKENGQLKYCLNKKVAFLAYSPLAFGLLSGKVGPETVFAADDLRAGNPRFAPENIRLIAEMLTEFSPLAEKYKVTIAQLVIAWTYNQPGCSHVLVGARKVEHAVENAQAGKIILSQEDLEIINQILKKYPAIVGCA